MNLIRKRAYSRAGLVGNPSDGYHGKTIAMIVRNFCAEVVLYEWDTLDIVLAQNDRARFASIHDLARDVKLHGYYGGIRLIKATIKRFVDYCQAQSIELHDQNFSVRYQTNVPRQVGMAGSSGIVIATLRCLMEFYHVDIPREAQPSVALPIEREELGITAGLQDRASTACRVSRATTTSRWTRRCCRPFTCRTTRTSASRPKCSTMTFGAVSTAERRKLSMR